MSPAAKTSGWLTHCRVWFTRMKPLASRTSPVSCSHAGAVAPVAMTMLSACRRPEVSVLVCAASPAASQSSVSRSMALTLRCRCTLMPLPRSVCIARACVAALWLVTRELLLVSTTMRISVVASRGFPAWVSVEAPALFSRRVCIAHASSTLAGPPPTTARV